MTRIVRIGGAGGFLGDSSVAAPQLLRGGDLDYMILDYLAEATMSVLGQIKAQRPGEGFARDFTEWVWKDNLREFKAQGVKVVTNAGGLNPRACRARMEELAAEAGLSFRIAVIEGDDEPLPVEVGLGEHARLEHRRRHRLHRRRLAGRGGSSLRKARISITPSSLLTASPGSATAPPASPPRP